MEIIKYDYAWRGNLLNRISTDFFLVHHAKALNCTVADIHRCHIERGFIGIGYNFFINKKGETYQGRPIDKSDADAQGYNYNSISVCLEGDFTQESMTDEQYASLVELKVYCDNYYKTILKSLRHKDVNDTSCPGNIPWIEILADIENLKRANKKKESKFEYVTKDEYDKLLVEYGNLEKEYDNHVGRINSLESKSKYLKRKLKQIEDFLEKKYKGERIR